MKVAILHNPVPEFARMDEKDLLVQIEAISAALSYLGHEPVSTVFSLHMEEAVRSLKRIRPHVVFNLVEAVEDRGSLIHLASAVLDFLHIPYTGAKTRSMFLTSAKTVAKKILHLAGILTPPWVCMEGSTQDQVTVDGPWILKSVWEHASVGLDEDSVIECKNMAQLCEAMNRRREKAGGEWFAEAYIEGREFNISLLAGKRGPEALPPAEILFEDYPPGKPRVVGYRAKWEEESFEYQHTPRSFSFSLEDRGLVDQLVVIAKECWRLFELRGYARVDFRVDQSGRPYVLEINANPCLSPEAGFAAAAQQAGLNYIQLIERILEDALNT
jgi:D-alanine-D-alanine ligase